MVGQSKCSVNTRLSRQSASAGPRVLDQLAIVLPQCETFWVVLFSIPLVIIFNYGHCLGAAGSICFWIYHASNRFSNIQISALMLPLSQLFGKIWCSGNKTRIFTVHFYYRYSLSFRWRWKEFKKIHVLGICITVWMPRATLRFASPELRADPEVFFRMPFRQPLGI